MKHPITDKSWTFLALEIDWPGYIVARFLLIFLPLLPIITQFIETQKLGHGNGHSKWIHVVAVMGSLMKIAYWFGQTFDLAILFQCFALIFGHLILSFQQMLIDRDEKGEMFWERNFVDFGITDFWNWTNVISYIECTLYIGIMLVVFVSLFANAPGFLLIWGSINLLLETILVLPQVFTNYLNQTTYGLNKSSVCLWTIGDIYKCTYYMIHSVPIIYISSGFLQITIDSIVLYQIFHYGDHPKQ